MLSHSQITLIILWLLYFAMHSLLASNTVKRRVSDLMPGVVPYYRLLYNLLATILLLPVLYLMYRYPGDVLWQWTGWWGVFMDTLAVIAIAAFIWSLRAYDSMEFLGITSYRDKRREVSDNGPFTLSVLHRYVRHPWYALALLLIWTRDMNEAFLISAILISLYLVIGSRLEENKLIACYGEQYREYRRLVPGLLPRPWRMLSRRQADKLLNMNNQTTERG